MHTLVGVIMSARSDWQAMKPATDMLARLRVGHEVRIMSIHGKSDKLYQYAESAQERGLKSLIISASSAAELPSLLASRTPLPVVGVPVRSGRSDGVESFLSFANLPVDIPMDALAAGHSGPVNAALLVAHILSGTNPPIQKALTEYAHYSDAISAAPKVSYLP